MIEKLLLIFALGLIVDAVFTYYTLKYRHMEEREVEFEAAS